MSVQTAWLLCFKAIKDAELYWPAFAIFLIPFPYPNRFQPLHTGNIFVFGDILIRMEQFCIYCRKHCFSTFTCMFLWKFLLALLKL